jgi:hypothetical protein
MAKLSPRKDLLPCLGERAEAVETVKPLSSSIYFQRIRIPPTALDRAGLRSPLHSPAAVGGSPFQMAVDACAVVLFDSGAVVPNISGAVVLSGLGLCVGSQKSKKIQPWQDSERTRQPP